MNTKTSLFLLHSQNTSASQEHGGGDKGILCAAYSTVKSLLVVWGFPAPPSPALLQTGSDWFRDSAASGEWLALGQCCWWGLPCPGTLCAPRCVPLPVRPHGRTWDLASRFGSGSWPQDTGPQPRSHTAGQWKRFLEGGCLASASQQQAEQQSETNTSPLLPFIFILLAAARLFGNATSPAKNIQLKTLLLSKETNYWMSKHIYNVYTVSVIVKK